MGRLCGGTITWTVALCACLAGAAPATAADTTPPALVEASAAPETVNVAYGAPTVTVRLRIVDESWYPEPTVQLKHATSYATSSYAKVELVSGTHRDGWYEQRLVLPTGAPTGTWQLTVSTLEDSEGNFSRPEPDTTVAVIDERIERGFRWTKTGSLGEARIYTPATRLADGRVLAAGGRSASDAILAGAELYSPATAQWTAAAPMSTPRYTHTMTRLRSGRILVTGGVNPSWGNRLASAEIYTPSTGAWTPTGSLSTARAGHTATVLADGRVLVAGGSMNDSGVPQEGTAEIYDPATGRWTATGSLTTARGEHTANLLPDGRVLVAGGCCVNDWNTGLASAETFDPATGAWRAAAPPPFGMIRHSATSLPDGRVLVLDGSYKSQKVAMYNPATKAWTLRAPGLYPGAGRSATLMPSGKVLVAGGGRVAELFDPAANRWTPVGGFYNGRGGHSATLLASGKVLFAGGRGEEGTTATSELLELDMKAPAVQPPSATLPVLGALDAYGRVPLQIGVSGSDAMTKAADLRWTVQERSESAGTWSAWASVLTAQPARPLTRYATPGRSYEHQARAADEAGNVSAFVPGPANRVRLEQETAAAATGAWEPVARSGASGGSVMTSTVAGATLRFPFTARRAAVVLPLRADLGVARICIDAGTPAERCVLRDLSPASGAGPRKLVYPFNVVSAGSEHAMSVTVSSGRVDVDGLALVGG